MNQPGLFVMETPAKEPEHPPELPPLGVRLAVLFLEGVTAFLGFLFGIAAVCAINVLTSLDFDSNHPIEVTVLPLLALVGIELSLALLLGSFWVTRYLTAAHRMGEGRRRPKWLSSPGRFFGSISSQVALAFSSIACFIGLAVGLRDGTRGLLPFMWCVFWLLLGLASYWVYRSFFRGSGGPDSKKSQG